MGIEFKMTPRLMAIASQVSKGETAADIGTDHGYLPLYLWSSGICPKVIMGDVSPGSLDKARLSCIEYFPEEDFDLRLGDGLDILEEGEVDTVIMAGIGGMLMADIMAWDMKKTVSFRKYILQPRNNPGYLRKWLDVNGFKIVKEQLVRERKFLCEIFTAISPDEPSNPHSQFDKIESCWQYPDILVEDSNSLTEEYLKFHLQKEEKIRENILKGRGEEAYSSPEYIDTCDRIERLKYLLDKLKA